jgi:DNA repair protein RecO (recombination protein O)
MRVALQPAFILHRRPYRDTSLLLEAFSRDYGRFGLVARGVRRPRSRLKGMLQPFTPLLLSWSGKGELMTLVAAEESEPPRVLPSARLLSGFYVNELLLRLLQRHDPHAGLFGAYERVLEDLASTVNEESALRVFEKQLLAELGYGLLLDAEARTNRPIEPQSAYRYVLEQGPVAADQSPVGIEISGKGLLALRFEIFDDTDVLREAKRLTRAAIGVHLQGRPLKTRELLIAVHRRREYSGSIGLP